MFHTGQQIGVYTLIKKLGEGGFGEVWLAENRHHSLDEKVAIKLPKNDRLDLDTLMKEIFNWNLAGKHKNILPIIECETFNNQVAIVSEFAFDGSLQDLINRKKILPFEEAVEITIEILDGLTHLHNRKIIHRDLKPDNILFQGKVPRLADFGISRAMTVTSRTEKVIGTLWYMAPETLDQKRNVQTDIWSVGVILYQMLTGSLPFPQRGEVELMGAIVMKEPAPLPSSVPSGLQKIIDRSLAKQPVDRYLTAAEMRQDLRNFLAAPTHHQTPFDQQPTIEFTIETPTLPKHFETEPSIITVIKSPSPAETITQVVVPPINLAPQVEALKLFPIVEKNKYGFADANGKVFIEPRYDWADSFYEGLALVKLEDRYGFVNIVGDEVIPVKYKRALTFSEGLAGVKYKGKWGYVDSLGNKIIDFMYDDAQPFNNGFANVRKKYKWFHIDKYGVEYDQP